MALEQEVVIYAKVTQAQGFGKANQIVHQEQHQIKTKVGRIRVRKERNDKAVNWKYTMTVKNNFINDGIQQSHENTVQINENIFNLFSLASESFFRKTRYLFKVEKIRVKNRKIDAEIDLNGVYWEVDRFIKEDGTYSQWVKIDVEVQTLKEKIKEMGLDPEIVKELGLQVTSIPLGLESIYQDDGSQEGRIRELTDLIYEKEFTRSNQTSLEA